MRITMMRFMANILVILLFVAPLQAIAALPSVAFFYGETPPLNQLQAYDVAVIDPEAGVDPRKYNSAQHQLFAYVTVGEVDDSSPYRKEILPQWILGRNATWHAAVIDQTQTAWQTFFLDHIITPLWEKGYRGFFLDTLDSYLLAVHGKSAETNQIAGLIKLIQSIKTKYPQAKLILNRGFPFIPAVKDDIYAVAAESLFAGWNEAKQKYEPVSASSRADLLGELTKVQQLGLPVIVIDYLPPSEHLEALQVAQKIMALNMVPWVADGRLQTLGVGSVQPINRKIFVLYTMDNSSSTFDASAFILLDLPLNYLGYVAEYHDANAALPDNFSPDNYAGIIVWAYPLTDKKRAALQAFLVKRLSQHIPILFMSGFGFETTTKTLAPFGITMPDETSDTPKSIHISQLDKSIMNYEIAVHPNRFEFADMKAKDSRVLLQLSGENNRIEDAVAITPWGGYALDPYAVLEMPNQSNFWVLNPLTLLTQALRLKQFPTPDSTTENGRRLMFIHIDGDGFVSRAEWRGGNFAAEELFNKILKVYRVPTTVSVITGDIAPYGLYPKLSPLLVKIARKIFALPWVEVATHTFSHPFDWVKVRTAMKSGIYNLPIPHYHFDSWTEIGGSIAYINQYLAPKHKPVRMLLWSGYANPELVDMANTYRAGVGNLNGGDVYIDNTLPSLTAIGANSRQQGNYVQVYAPMDNEEYYTNGWGGPFYGFERVVQTFQLTDSPHRFKPIDIYYHFYSASKLASLVALHKVYDYALSQPVMNVYASDYFSRVLDARATSIALVNGGYQIRSQGVMREVRVPVTMGYPDLARSQNLIGYTRINDSYYLHLGPATEALLYFNQQESTLPYLASANGIVTVFQRTADGITMRLRGNLSLQWTLGNAANCTVKHHFAELKNVGKPGNLMTYQLSAKDSDDLRITCRH